MKWKKVKRKEDGEVGRSGQSQVTKRLVINVNGVYL